MSKLALRCSALPLAFKCAGSVRPSAVSINDTNEAAELGTAAHAGLAQLVDTGRVDWEGIPELARIHGVGETDLRVLIAQGAKLWEVVKESFPDALTEVALEHEGPGYVLTGHVDVYGRSVDTARLADWKGGRLDSPYREQLLGYAALALFDDHSLEDAAGGILWVRDGDYEPYSMRREGLQAWEDRLVEEVVEWSGEYRPGPHCEYCRRNHECPAANAQLRRDLAIVADRDLIGHAEDADTLATWSPKEKIDLVEKLRMGQHLLKRLSDALRTDAIRSGGEISDGERRLVVVTEERRSLDPVKAFPVLAEAGFSDEDMARVIKMSASEAEEIVYERAGKGDKKRAKEALRKTLEAAEAIQTEEIRKMVIRRA